MHHRKRISVEFVTCPAALQASVDGALVNQIRRGTRDCIRFRIVFSYYRTKLHWNLALWTAHFLLMDSDTNLKRTVSFVPPRTTYSSLAIFKTRNGERGTGNGERGTGNRESENRGIGKSGNGKGELIRSENLYEY